MGLWTLASSAPGVAAFALAAVEEVSTPSDPRCARPTGWDRFGCDSRTLAGRLALRQPADRRRAAVGLAVTASLYGLRDEIREEVLEEHSSGRTRLYEDARLISRGVVAPVLAGALYVAGRVSGETRHAEAAQIVLTSTLYSGALTGVGSLALAAERPEEGDSVRFFQSGGHGVSLDVALAAAVVAPVDRLYLRSKPEDSTRRRALKGTGRGLLYTAVFLTGLQRMDADKHWAPDVFLGAAAGFSTGYSLCTAHGYGGARGGTPAAESGDPRVRTGLSSRVPEILPALGGISLSWRF